MLSVGIQGTASWEFSSVRPPMSLPVHTSVCIRRWTYLEVSVCHKTHAVAFVAKVLSHRRDEGHRPLVVPTCGAEVLRDLSLGVSDADEGVGGAQRFLEPVCYAYIVACHEIKDSTAKCVVVPQTVCSLHAPALDRTFPYT